MNILVGVYTKQSVWHVDLRSGLKASELVNKWSEKIYKKNIDCREIEFLVVWQLCLFVLLCWPFFISGHGIFACFD